MTPPPDLPYAPKRTRPLSLWNPLDYLTLLYWVFYFPQAIRWYVETFGSTDWQEDIWWVVRKDSAQRKLIFQGAILILAVPILFVSLLHLMGVRMDWGGVRIGMITGVIFGVLFGLIGGAAVGVACGVGGGVIGSVIGGVVNQVVIDSLGTGIAGVTVGVTIVVVVGVSVGMASRMAGGMVLDVVFELAFAFMFGVVFGLAFGVAFGMVYSKLIGVVVLVGVGLMFVMGSVRLDAWLLGIVAQLLAYKSQGFVTARVSPLPHPKLQTLLCDSLRTDWDQGLLHCEGLLRYTLQFIPVVGSLQDALRDIPTYLLLPRLARWASMELYDWDVIRYQSAPLTSRLKQEFWDYFSIVPRRLRPQINHELCLDTSAQAACAAFWLLHTQQPARAAEAFAKVKKLPYGTELCANAEALARATVQAKTLDTISKWRPPPDPPDAVLRPAVREALLTFGQVAEEAGQVLASGSPRQRNTALSRATGALTDMLDQVEFFPTPERDILESIARRWREILLSHATEVGTLAVREPVTSPYIVGAIVPAERLVGRADIFSELQAAWAKPGPRQSLVIYGHRRMGKSSIARALLHFCHFGEETGLAVLNLQAVDWSGGRAYLAHAIAFELWRALPTPLPTPSPDDFAAHPVPALRGWLAHLHTTHPARRYLLILDEYELLEEKLSLTLAREFVSQLRGLTQQESWLAVALVGLHTLKEQSADNAWRTLHVGLMNKDAVTGILQVEDDEFPLEYDLDAIARAHYLTGGQPFLVQLLGDSLVQRFNRRLRQEITPPRPLLTAADVNIVTSDPMFFEQGDAYFRGIWAQAGQAPAGQHALLRALAPHPDGLGEAAWQAAANLDANTFAQAKEALARHDVIACTGGTCRYTVELLRRWVAEGLKVEG